MFRRSNQWRMRGGLGVRVLAATLATGCANTGADDSNVASSEAVAPRSLSQAELDAFSKALNRPAPLYYYQTYRYDWSAREYQLVRGGSLHAYLAPVPPERLEKLADGTFTDGRFNRITMQPVELEGEAHTFAFTGTPDGTRIYSVADPREVGRVRFAVIERYRELISVIAAAEALRNLPCVQLAARRGATGGLLRCLGMPESGSSGGGGAGTGDGGLPEFDSPLLSEPDCKYDPRGRVYQAYRQMSYEDRIADAERIEEEAQQWDNLARGATSASDRRALERLADTRRADANRTRELAEAERQESGVRDNPSSSARAIERAERTTCTARDNLRRAEEKSFDAYERAYHPRTRGGGGGSPPIGETPQVQDPRCEGREVDAARGTLFTNRAFCGGDDPLTCLRREQDSLYGLTDGQCWTETGPDDSRQIVCARGEDESERPGVDGGVEVPECEAQDADCFTDPVAPRNPRGQVMLRYVDVTPLGAFLIGWCARGGCPDPAALQ